MNVTAIRTHIFSEGDTLAEFVFDHIPKLRERSIVVITSKIVALAEGRVQAFSSQKQKELLIRSESDVAIKTKHAWLTVKDGVVLPSAGVDESNANQQLILLPENSFAAAESMRRAIKKKFRLKQVGVIITDSRVLPLRAGVVGVALGYAGFRGLKDYRGSSDIFGRTLKMTSVDVADALATAAVLEMGEGNERQPLAVIEGARAEFVQKVDPNELKIALRDDLFRPLFARVRGLL